MTAYAMYGILIPFLGTALGAACVLFMKKAMSDHLQRALSGFAAGVMVAASIWSLLIPALEQAGESGLDGAFVLHIQAGSGLVQQHHRRVL